MCHLSMNLILGYTTHHYKGFSGFMGLENPQGSKEAEAVTGPCPGRLPERLRAEKSELPPHLLAILAPGGRRKETNMHS